MLSGTLNNPEEAGVEGPDGKRKEVTFQEIFLDPLQIQMVQAFSKERIRKSIESNKLDAIDALISGFPAGTVSGAPKIRAMEIIDELEKNKRKLYAGGIGYFTPNGEFDTCIALRTAVAKKGKFYVQAGAGIVADSVPKKEYDETVNKAKALINALR